ncbi:MAG: hypothetical protein WBG63_18635, partial [Phormidesmis sp.]
IHHSSFITLFHYPQGDGNEENDEVRSRNDELKAARAYQSFQGVFLSLPSVHHSSFIVLTSLQAESYLAASNFAKLSEAHE